ncbi:MAG TPA: hypothetical protein VGX23_15415 [Actinocrinis sp.]|nr:hypothetical protein [Actinocrinis sp.]
MPQHQPAPRPPGRRRTTRRTIFAMVTAAIPVIALATAVWLPTDAQAAAVPPAPVGMSTVYSDGFGGAAGTGVDSSWTYDIGTQYNGSG